MTTTQGGSTGSKAGRGRTPRVVFCWTHISGYMAACWRALAQSGLVELTVIAARASKAQNIAFDEALLAGVNHRFVDEADLNDPSRYHAVLRELDPDVIVLCGWAYKAFVTAPFAQGLKGRRFIMTSDTPWRGTVRQTLGRFAKRSFFGAIEHVFVPGERAWMLARVLGFREDQISKGLYGIDFAALSGLHAQRSQGEWPRRFVYMGRYVDVKGVDILAEAYAAYRRMVQDPWPLTTMGTGPMRDALVKVEGVEDLGFVQPSDQPAVLVRSGAFVLASRFDPWPLVVVEACAAGLPVICTSACGSAVELVRPYSNGVIVPTGDVAALARGMAWTHAHHDQLAEFGARGRVMAQAYAASVWVERWRVVLGV